MNPKTVRERLIEAGVDAAELAQVGGDNGLDLHEEHDEYICWFSFDIIPSEILRGAFLWEDTPQGFDYWYEVLRTLLEKEQLEGGKCE